MRPALFSVLIIVTVISPCCFCWGIDGHAIVAHLAEKQLHAKARENIVNLFKWINTWDYVSAYPFFAKYPPNVRELADIASVSDYSKNITESKIRTDLIMTLPAWSAGEKFYNIINSTTSLHFINLSSDGNYICDRKYLDICERYENLPSEFPCVADCITKAILYYRDQLANPKSRFIAANSLFHLVHLIGDIHQPLHSGYADDRGGNEAYVYYPDTKKCLRLHFVWDISLLEKYVVVGGSDWKRYTTFQVQSKSAQIYKTLTNQEFEDPFQWVQEISNLYLDTTPGEKKHNGPIYSKLEKKFYCANDLDYGTVTISLRKGE